MSDCLFGVSPVNYPDPDPELFIPADNYTTPHHLAQLSIDAFEPEFYGQFRKIIVRYKRIGYNINIMRQSACLVFNPITVNNFASVFNCTPVGRASDSMMAPT